MNTQFAPMSSQTVTFAKAYRSEQLQAAGRARIVARFRNRRHRVRDWLGRRSAVAIHRVIRRATQAEGTTPKVS